MCGWYFTAIQGNLIKRVGPTGIGGEAAFQDMLAPALAGLPKDDQAYSAEVATGESFEDLIDLFSASFTVIEDAPMIIERGDET